MAKNSLNYGRDNSKGEREGEKEKERSHNLHAGQWQREQRERVEGVRGNRTTKRGEWKGERDHCTSC